MKFDRDRWTTAEIAEYLKYTRRYVTERIVSKRGFPTPVVNTSRKNRQWDSMDVMKWAAKGG